MADRNLDFSPQVTQVTPTLPTDGLATAGFEIMDQIAQSSAQAKALSATAQTSLAFRQLDQNYRTSAASNPNDPQALADLQQARQDVIAKIGENVPAIAQRDYQMQTIELKKTSDSSNMVWGTRQLMRNASGDLQTAYTTNLQQAAMDGRQFAASGAPSSGVEGAMRYQQIYGQMMQAASPIIGEEKAGAYLKSFQSDYTKTFVSSVAETNPQLANNLLQQPGIADHFTPNDIDDMQAVIRKTVRAQQLIQSGQKTNNDASLTDIVNDPESTYYEKRSKIDQLDMEGSISPKAASAARRVIKSSNDLDTQTDTPAMATIINQAYDLNANASTNADDYLLGVRNIQQQVLEMQADGKLTAPDAKKLTGQLTNLTNAKMSSATQTAGLEFYDANQQFNALPPEYRGQATRALFYAGQGQNWSQQQYKAQAGTIIDQINASRRQQAQDTVQGVNALSDSDFLKTVPNATPAAIAETAKKYGITEQQVIQQLRASNAARARAQQEGVKKVAPRGGGDDEDRDEGVTPDPGIKLPAPPPMQDEYDDGDDK